jgi:outer membrane protein assembly factor BamD (BamD/ComL family)
MTMRIPCLLTLALCVALSASCGSDDDMIMLAGDTHSASSEGEALYAKAKATDDAGKSSSAIKQYNKMAEKYPFAPSAAQARFRQAELLEQKGDIQKSFDAYQKFLTRYQSSGLYSKALERQARMAQSAADGDVKSSFAGLKTKLSIEKTVEMLAAVRDNAPRSNTSAKAQFTIGELYQGKKESKNAIEAYRKSVSDQPESSYAPEALFRVGVVLLEEADRGNRNQATLELSREAFSDYLLQYPGHSKNAEARMLSGQIGGREINRSLDIAEFYDKSGQTESAKIYYREVLKRAGSGEAHDKAKSRLKALGE